MSIAANACIYVIRCNVLRKFNFDYQTRTIILFVLSLVQSDFLKNDNKYSFFKTEVLSW